MISQYTIGAVGATPVAADEAAPVAVDEAAADRPMVVARPGGTEGPTVTAGAGLLPPAGKRKSKAQERR